MQSPASGGPIWVAPFWLSACLFVVVGLGGCPEPNPDPHPNPDPAPVGLRVLAVYETDDLDNMPPGQADIFANKILRAWLAANCKDEDGQPAFRFLDKDNDVSRLSDAWQALFREALQLMEQLKIQQAKQISAACKNGTLLEQKPISVLLAISSKGKYSGDLPADAEAMLILLSKYAEGN